MIGSYLPHLGNITAVGVVWGVGAVVMLAGTALCHRRAAPEIGFGAGWGGLCLLLTLWGVFLPVTLGVPAVAFAIGAVATLLLPRRLPCGEWRHVFRVMVLALPLWLVMAPIRPSQPDTFLNLLPNAMYLVDYGRFPTSLLPPSHSYLPAAPYDTQFLSFLGALADRNFPPSGMALINVMLFLFAGLAIARELAMPRPGAALPWGVIALGLLLAILLNPGFVPRIDFAAYGEPALMVTALLAAILFVRAQSALAAGEPAAGLGAVALILAAMLNAKQSGIGLVVAIVGAAAIAAISERAVVPRRAALGFVALAPLPALLLYGVWRYYVAHAGVAELSVLPVAAWHWAVLPRTIVSIAEEIAEKPVYFGAVAIAIAALPIGLRRHGWTPTTRLLALNAAAFVLYNGFLIAAYLVGFSAEMSAGAHSYFRYNTHLSLVLVLALASAARDAGLGAMVARGRRRWPAAAAIAVAMLGPLAFAGRLRFDLVMPQPLVWNLAARLKPYLGGDRRLALLLPGDNGSVSAMLAGVLRDVAPRRPLLDLLRLRRADAAALAEAARLGYDTAFISCTTGATGGVPSGVAALLAHDSAGWHPLAVWPYPPDDTRRRWQYILAWPPLCRRA